MENYLKQNNARQPNIFLKSFLQISGFTLTEVVVVLTIIFVLAVKSLPKWSPNTINLAAQTKQLVSDIQFARTLAMTRGQRFYWIKTSNNSYQVRNSTNNPVQLAFGNTTVTLSSGIAFGTLSSLPNSLINFDGRGIPYTDLNSPGAALSATANIPLTMGANTLTAQITPTSGRVTYS